MAGAQGIPRIDKLFEILLRLEPTTVITLIILVSVVTFIYYFRKK